MAKIRAVQVWLQSVSLQSQCSKDALTTAADAQVGIERCLHCSFDDCCRCANWNGTMYGLYRWRLHIYKDSLGNIALDYTCTKMRKNQRVRRFGDSCRCASRYWAMPVLYVGRLQQMRKSEVNNVCTVALTTAADAQITNHISNYRPHEAYRFIVWAQTSGQLISRNIEFYYSRHLWWCIRTCTHVLGMKILWMNDGTCRAHDTDWWSTQATAIHVEAVTDLLIHDWRIQTSSAQWLRRRRLGRKVPSSQAAVKRYT
jgi:hypothetical protein